MQQYGNCVAVWKKEKKPLGFFFSSRQWGDDMKWTIRHRGQDGDTKQTHKSPYRRKYSATQLMKHWWVTHIKKTFVVPSRPSLRNIWSVEQRAPSTGLLSLVAAVAGAPNIHQRRFKCWGALESSELILQEKKNKHEGQASHRRLVREITRCRPE